jgi:hypothetical protein
VRHAGGVGVRTPLLPLATLADLTGNAARAVWLAGGDLDAAVRADEEHLDERLRALLANPLVRSAIAYASPDLAAALDRGEVPRAALAYVARMAGRYTPFGLFAGCASGAVDGEPRYDLAPRESLRVRWRADVRHPRPSETYVPNSTLHVAADRLRFVERAAGAFHGVAVEEDEALRLVLDAARDGARLPDLAALLAGDGVSGEEADGYVVALTEAQVLVPDAPSVTGPQPEGDGHADSSRPVTFVLGDRVLAEAHRAVEVLHPLYRPTGLDDDLARFRTAFRDRWGEAAVPLLAALDEETGIGFGPPTALAAAGAPLLASFDPVPSTDGPPWTPVDHHLVDLLSRALRERSFEIDLGHDDLYPLRNQDPRPLPDALALLCTVAARDAAAVANGDFRLVVHGATGPNAAALLARFADLDPGLDALARNVIAAEEALRPDAAHAEVIHLPDGRSANVAVRPVLRSYEIPLLGGSGVPPERRVALADLTVAVEGDRVVLRSEHLGREVLPRLTAAHDHRTSPVPAYRFLGAVQHDGLAGTLRWSWGQVQSAPFLPRVVTGRLVLARAQWRWFRAELRALMSATTNAARYDAVQRLREAWDVPRWATLANADQEIPLDLDGVGAAVLLAHEARRAGQLWLREQHPAPGELCLTGPDGGYVHEVVLPLVAAAPAFPPAAVRPTPGRAYVPGSERLGVRLFTGPVTADAVLREVVAPLVAGVTEWSYERVADPAPHLRLALPGELLPAVRNRVAGLVENGRLTDVRMDTYRPAPAVAEAVARADSVAALRIVARTDLDGRWRAAFWSIDRLLADAGLDVPGRRAFVRERRALLVAAHGDTGTRAARLAGRLYRRLHDGLVAPEPWLAEVLDARSAVLAALLAQAPPEVLGDACAGSGNRLLRAAHDVQQLVLYGLLDRWYSGVLATAAAPGR